MNSWVVVAYSTAVLLLIIQILSTRIKEKKSIIVFSVILILVSNFAQFKNSVTQNNYSDRLEDTVKSLHKILQATSTKVDSSNFMLAQSSQLLSNISDAIQKANYRYDTARNVLIPTIIKAQFNIPNAIFHGSVQQGNRNTQNN